MKIGIITCLSIVTLWAICGLLQLWINIMPAAIFIKLSITCAVIAVICLIITLAVREYSSDKTMKENGYLDD